MRKPSRSITNSNFHKVLPFLEFVGYPNSGGIAKTKATGTLRWNFHNWVAAWTVVYYDGYKQYGAPGDPEVYQGIPIDNNPNDAGYNPIQTGILELQGGYTVPSQTYNNIYLSYTFRRDPFDRASRWGRCTNSLLEGMRISLTVNDIFDAYPPFDAKL